MKKIVLILIALSMLFLATACSNNTNTDKTEEELREQIRAELEAEEKLRKELEAEISAQMEAEKQQKEGSTPVAQTTIEEETAIVLSAFMTKDQIIERLGDNYTFETREDGGYYDYYSTLEYDGIVFSFPHNNKKFPLDQYPSGITITSYKYRFNYDFNIGDPALEVIASCEKNFENAYDFHNDMYIFDSFQYKEDHSPKGTTDGGLGGLRMRFFYNTSRSYASKDEMSQDVKIESIQIFAPMD